MDAALTHWINAAGGINPFLDRAMVGVTQIGVPLMVLALAL
jgi:undecaprenyl-diphosphatase